VRIENETVSSTVRNGNVDVSYPDILSQTLRFQAFVDAKKQWTIGLKTWLPLEALATINTGNIYQPEYALYRVETQRPRVLLTSAIGLGDDWRVGLGADLGFSVNAQATVYLQTGTTPDGQPKLSDEQISSKVKPTFIPQASIQFKDFTLAAKGENKVDMDVDVTAAARVFVAGGAVNYAYVTDSALYYQPWEIEFLADNAITDSFRMKWGASYQLWSRYQVRAAVISGDIPTQCDGNGACATYFSPTGVPSSKPRDILVPEIVAEFHSGSNRYQIGYRYKPSIFEGLPTGDNTNYVDPPRQDLYLGAILTTKGGWEWNLHGRVSKFATQNVVKTTTDGIGWPGYQTGGWIYGGGVSLAIPIRN
jgi:hypothetical protein